MILVKIFNPCNEIASSKTQECVLPMPKQDDDVVSHVFDLLKEKPVYDKKDSCWSCSYSVFEGTHMFCKNEDNYGEWVNDRRITNGVCPCDMRGKCDRFEKG